MNPAPPVTRTYVIKMLHFVEKWQRRPAPGGTQAWSVQLDRPPTIADFAHPARGQSIATRVEARGQVPRRIFGKSRPRPRVQDHPDSARALAPPYWHRVCFYV